MIETLESRQLFATVVIAGTPDADVITVGINANNSQFMQVFVNGAESNYAAVTSIQISGGTGNDQISVISDITVPTVISGNAGYDTITAGGGADQITGNAGNDVIYGGKGDDVINGGDGGDYINGGDGDDTLVGGLGPDDIYGGGKLTDSDSLYQNDGTNADDGAVDDLYGTWSSSFFKTSRDTATIYS